MMYVLEFGVGSPLLDHLESCLLPDVPGRLLEARVALLVCAPSAESEAHDGWPRPPLEQQDGEDDAKAESQGGLYQEVGEASVPLRNQLALGFARLAHDPRLADIAESGRRLVYWSRRVSSRAYLLVQKCLADWSRDGARRWRRDRRRLGHFGHLVSRRALSILSRQLRLAIGLVVGWKILTAQESLAGRVQGT